MTRRKIIENIDNHNLIDTSQWTTVLVDNLPDKDKNIYLARKKAVDMYINNKSMDEITKETNIHRNDVRRLVRRCLETNDVGMIYGYTALIPYKRIKKYNRSEESTSFTGAFSLLLEKYPELKELIINEYFNIGKKDISEPIIRINILHKKFLRKCIKLGIMDTEYPFNTNDKGERSLYRYVNYLKKFYYGKYTKRYGEDAYKRHRSTGIGEQNNPLITKPFQQVQFDGHKIDIIITIKFKTIEGDTIVKPLSRIWLLAIIDNATRVILGYHLCLGTEYSSADVLKCIENAVVPKEKMNFKIKGLEYPHNGGFHSLCIPETKWALWDEFLYDNAKANLAKNVIEKLTQVTKCSVNAGPVSVPERRSIIERFFGILEERGFHRLANTTGNNAKDPRRKQPEKNAVEYEISESEIEELTEILIANYNNTPHDGINGFTPLEVMKQRIKRGQIPKIMPESERSDVAFLSISAVRTVCGNVKSGRRPYIMYEGVEYRNDVLARMPDLIGKKLTLLVNINDLRTIKAFLSDGSEFGTLTAKGKWSIKPHTIKMRQEINKLRRNKDLSLSIFDDPIEVYHEYLINKSKNNRSSRNKLAILTKTQEKLSAEIAKSKLDNQEIPNIDDNRDNNLTNSDTERIEELKKYNIFKTFNL